MVKDLKGSKRTLCGRGKNDFQPLVGFGGSLFSDKPNGGFCCVMICKFEYLYNSFGISI